MKRKLVTALIAGGTLLMLLWLHTHAFIEISLEKASGGDVTYALFNQRNEKTTQLKSTDGSIKKLVRKGSYEVLARQGGQSYFALVDAGGWLRTTTASGQLSPERARKFVGDNPLPCMHLVSGVLLSLACGDTLNNLKVHIPAANSRPTYTAPPARLTGGFVEAIVTTKEGPIALVKTVTGEDLSVAHMVYRLGSNGEVTGGVALPDLKEEFYSATAYRDGFLAYDTAGSSIYYYSSPQAAPTKVNIAGPRGKGLRLYSLHVLGDTIAITYSTSKLQESIGFDDPEGEKAHSEEFEAHSEPEQSEVIIFRNNASRHYKFDSIPRTARPCGTDKLCFLHEGQLTIYDVSGTKQKQLFRVTGVNDVQQTPNGVLVARQSGLLNLSVDKREGSLDYTLGDYAYCGIQTYINTYVLCLTNPEGRRAALQIEQTQPDTDSIDKKIAALSKMDEIKSVSIYERFIFISPDLGELVYNPNLRIYDYDTAVRQRVSATINKKIDELDIDRARYTIVNTLE